MQRKTKKPIRVVHCYYCDVRHDSRQSALKCCHQVRTEVYYECPLCYSYFRDKIAAEECMAQHTRIQDARKNVARMRV